MPPQTPPLPSEEEYLSRMCDKWKSDPPAKRLHQGMKSEESSNTKRRKRDVVAGDQDVDILSKVHQITTLHTLTAKQRNDLRIKLSKKYKKFIPGKLPPAQKRCRPVCLFVNYLGSRRPTNTNTTTTTESSLASAANTVSDDMSLDPLTEFDRKNLDKLFPGDIPMSFPDEDDIHILSTHLP
jgi:hypothetical protein